MRWIRQEQGHPQTWGSGLTIEWNVWASQPIWNNIRFYDVTVLDNGVDGCSRLPLGSCRSYWQSDRLPEWILDRLDCHHSPRSNTKSDRIPQRSKGLGTMITYPNREFRAEMINHRPNPQLVLFLAHKGFEFIKFPTWGSALGSNYPVSSPDCSIQFKIVTCEISVTRLMPRTPMPLRYIFRHNCFMSSL